MPAVNPLWRSLCRHIVGPGRGGASAARADLTEEDSARRAAQSLSRSRFRRFFRLCDTIKEYFLHAQRKNAQAWQDALQKERRAKRRSLCLLLKLLSDEQRREFRRSRQFHVIGGCTGVRYRIRVDPFSNIDVLYPNGTVKHQLCVHPTGEVPIYDKLAAQMLYLQDATTERRLLRKANILPARAGSYVSSSAAAWH